MIAAHRARFAETVDHIPYLRAGSAEPALLDRVIALRDGTEDAFLAAGGQLIEVAGLLNTARTAAMSLDHLARIGLMDQLRSEADSRSTAFDTLAAEFGTTQSGIRTLTSALSGFGNDMKDVRRSIMTMRLVVLNARVTLAALRTQDQRLMNFAQGGQAVVAATSDLLERFENTMADILSAVSMTEGLVGRISDTLTFKVLIAFQDLMKDVAVFEQEVRAISSRGAKLSNRLQALQDATNSAVTGLQIGDKTRQQLDHAVFILAHPKGDDPALQALAAALVCDAAQAHKRMLDQLRGSVAQMTSGLTDLVDTHLAGFLGTGASTVGADTLVRDNANLAQEIAALDPIQQETRALGQTMADQFQTFRDLIAKGELVQQDTRLIGINAVLSCTRLGQEGAALKVIAEQLQVVSLEVGGRFATIRGSLGRISGLGVDIMSGTERLVQESIEVPEQLTSSIGPMIRSIAEHVEPVQQAVKQLQDRLSGLVFNFEPALRHNCQLEELASQLGGRAMPIASDHISDATLAEIYAIFTIEQERNIFRAILPDRADTASKSTFKDHQAQVEDDFFF